MAAVAPSAPLASLQDVPEELLTRILSLACAGDDGLGAEVLFRLGGLCAALRRACGSVGEAAAPMADAWSRAVIALVDPAAALLAAVSAQSRGLRTDARSCYFPQARALGGWYPLVHALANRECVECEDVTRLLACRIEGGAGREPFGLCRCCAGCTPPGAAADVADDEASESSESRGILRCAVLNQQFWTAEPSLVLDAADWAHSAMKLMICLEEAGEGDTIGLRGAFENAHFNTAARKAVRLLGMPDATPYRWVHAARPDDEPGQRMAQLRRFELESAAALGFPSALIHVERNCFEVYDTAWLENIYISSGLRDLGTELPDEHEFEGEQHTILTPIDEQPCRVFSGLSIFKNVDALPVASAVLCGCWLTGYFGGSLVLNADSCAALLRCVITNSRFMDVHAPPGASLRMRGCRVMYSLAPHHDSGFLEQPDNIEPLHALARANHFFRFTAPVPPNDGAAAATAEQVRPHVAGFTINGVRLLN
jgi:hypothetical protein